MHTIRTRFVPLFSVLALLAVLFTGCKKDADDDVPEKTTYNLLVKDVLGVSGTVTFTETSSTQTTIEIVLTGITSGTHPAHIHANSAVESGGIVITLNPVDASGRSSTVVTQKDDGTAFNYDQLTGFDGYINVHESSGNLTTILAQGDIGGNALTTTKKTYNLLAVGSSGVSGTALLEKRVNGNTLLTLSLNGTISGGSHPAHIHIGSITTPGGIVISLNPVDGATGKSFTNVRELDDTTPIKYDGLLTYTGYLNVHLSMADLGTILCQGNIGSNE